MKRAAKLSPGEMADDVGRFASGLATIQDELAGLNRAAQSKGSTRETSEPLPITLTLTAYHPHPHPHPNPNPNLPRAVVPVRDAEHARAVGQEARHVLHLARVAWLGFGLGLVLGLG